MQLFLIIALFMGIAFTPMRNVWNVQEITQLEQSSQTAYAELLMQQHNTALNYCFPNKPPHETNMCSSSHGGGSQIIPVHPTQNKIWQNFTSWTDGNTFIATTICNRIGTAPINPSWIAQKVSENSLQSSRVFVIDNGKLTNGIVNRSYEIPPMPAGNPCPHNQQVLFINEINPYTLSD